MKTPWQDRIGMSAGVGLFLLIIAAACGWFWVIPWLIAAEGGLLTVLAARRFTEDGVCRAFLYGSYGIKILLAIFFYNASVHNWPILSAYNGGEGYWSFADDAQAHHNYGLWVSRYWQGTGDFPKMTFSNWSFVLYVAVIYRWLGEQPLILSFLNAGYGTVLTLSGLVILKRLNASPHSIRLGVGLLAFWPSLVFWSSQPLKDPLLLAMILFALTLLIVVLSGAVSQGIRSWGLLALLGLSCMSLHLFRNYLGMVMSFLAPVASIALVTQAVRNRQYQKIKWPVIVAVWVMICVSFASRIDLRGFVKPNLHAKQATENSASIGQVQTRAASVVSNHVLHPPSSSDEPIRSWSKQLGVRIEATVASTPPAQTPPQPLVSMPDPAPVVSEPQEVHSIQEKAPIVSAKTEPGHVPISAAMPAVSPVVPTALPATSEPTGDIEMQSKKKWKWFSKSNRYIPSLTALAGLRRGFVSTGGHSAIDPEIKFTKPLDVIWYLPRSLSLALLAPLPWQWLENDGRVGVLRPFSAVEMILIYIILIGFVLKFPVVLRKRGIALGILALFVVLIAVPMSLTVANLGTLFRLRLQFLLPLWVIVASVGIFEGYRWPR